eukprot:GCRY01001075.1.p1 GENE.GCRY01001075.1~~GCRY01001075.1.p1  ORF type:complete len:432 (+),score=66.32 GCRY01001075.1:282-1577(+)
MFHFFPAFANAKKTTSSVLFQKSLKGEGNKEALEVINSLNSTRKVFVDKHVSAETTLQDATTAFSEYASALSGLYSDPSSNLRFQVSFVWSNVLGNVTSTESLDVQMEYGQILFVHAYWLLNFASVQAEKAAKLHLTELGKLASGYGENMIQCPELDNMRKEMYHSLLKAAGLFSEIKTTVASEIIAASSPLPTDFQEELLDAWTELALAQAQEITVGRAIHMQHSPSLVSKLSYEVAAKYSNIYQSLLKWDFPQYSGGKVSKLRLYANYKRFYYNAVGHHQRGAFFYSPAGGENTGLAIAIGRQVGPLTKACIDQILPYMKIKPKVPKQLETELLFEVQNLEKQSKMSLDKWEKMNMFVTNSKIPDDIPAPDRKCLVTPAPFEGFRNEKWTDSVTQTLESKMVKYATKKKPSPKEEKEEKEEQEENKEDQ